MKADEYQIQQVLALREGESAYFESKPYDVHRYDTGWYFFDSEPPQAKHCVLGYAFFDETHVREFMTTGALIKGEYKVISLRSIWPECAKAEGL